MLGVFEAFLTYHGHIHLRLDGATKVEQRQVSTVIIYTPQFSGSPLTWKYLETWENLETATFSIQNLENGGLGQFTKR